MPASNLPAVEEQSLDQQPRPTAVTAPTFNFSIAYLRTFLTLLVVAHHAALAYIPFAPEPPSSISGPNRIWQAFPVVDSERSSALGLFVGFNDMFFMALILHFGSVRVEKPRTQGRSQFPPRSRSAFRLALRGRGSNRCPAGVLPHLHSEPSRRRIRRLLAPVAGSGDLARRPGVVRLGSARL